MNRQLENTHQSSQFPLPAALISTQPPDPALGALLAKLEELFVSKRGHRVGTLAAREQCKAIVEHVAASLYVERDQILGTSRTQHLAFTRQVAIYLCRKLTGLSFPKIGEYFHRDHSSVIHAYNVIRQRIDDPAHGPAFSKLITRLEEQITAIPATTQAVA